MQDDWRKSDDMDEYAARWRNHHGEGQETKGRVPRMWVRHIAYGGGAPNIDDDAAAWAKTVTVSAARLSLVSNTIRSLKAAGIWPILDRFLVPAAENSLQGRTCWKSLVVATAINSPTFTANRGFTSDGLSSYLDSNYPPASGPNFTLNSGAIFEYSNTSRAAGDLQPIGVVNGATAQVLISSFFTGSVGVGRVNNSNATGASGATADNLGLCIASRTAGNLTTMYKRSASLGTVATASASIPAGNLAICALNNDGIGIINFDTARVAAAGAASGLTGAQAASLNTILEAHLSAIGASA